MSIRPNRKEKSDAGKFQRVPTGDVSQGDGESEEERSRDAGINRRSTERIEFDGGVVAASDLINLTSAAKILGCSRQHAGLLASGKSRGKGSPLRTITIDGVRYTTEKWCLEFDRRTKPVAPSDHHADVNSLRDQIARLERQLAMHRSQELKAKEAPLSPKEK